MAKKKETKTTLPAKGKTNNEQRKEVGLPPMGRPTLYSPEMVEKICLELAKGHSLKQVCKAEGMPCEDTVYEWLYAHEDFSDKYMRARRAGWIREFDNITEIADDSSQDTIIYSEYGPQENKEWVNRSRLRVEVRKWGLAKMLPKIFGDKLEVDLGTKDITVRIAGLGDVE